MPRRRLDAELLRRGLVASVDEALAVIDAGRVTVNGGPVSGVGTLVAPDEPVHVSPSKSRFVSRGGDKLDAALDRFGIDPGGRGCLDAGVSTGGFTDCLLQRGADRVLAVDVGYGQLAWSLRTDPRVIVMERTNVRDIEPAALPFAPSLITADLSFVGLASVVPALVALCGPAADLVLLVKPQFEAPPSDVGPGGVVRDPRVWAEAIATVADACGAAGAGVLAAAPSPIRGQAGNVEFLLHAAAGAPGGHHVEDVVAEVERR